MAEIISTIYTITMTMDDGDGDDGTMQYNIGR